MLECLEPRPLIEVCILATSPRTPDRHSIIASIIQHSLLAATPSKSTSFANTTWAYDLRIAKHKRILPYANNLTFFFYEYLRSR